MSLWGTFVSLGYFEVCRQALDHERSIGFKVSSELFGKYRKDKAVLNIPFKNQGLKGSIFFVFIISLPEVIARAKPQ